MSTPELPRFKRRKTTHAKRLPASSFADSPDSADIDDTLQDVLRTRKRPRLRETTQKTEPTQSQALAVTAAPPKSACESRFVPQTGEVFQRDDQQMTEYVEACLAEKNHRLYGWPIPRHLETAVAALAPEHRDGASVTRIGRDAQVEQNRNTKSTVQSYRVAAGMGKLEEVELGPNTATQSANQSRKARLGRDGKPRRQARRNSEDLRRDQMVEAVLREAKLDYFEEDKPTGPAAGSGADNDDAMLEKFRLEFLESIQTRQQRKAAPAARAKGAKEASRGPKLGGSRSARAAMRLQEEQAAKKK